MLRSITLGLATVGLITLLCGCSSSDSGTAKTEPPVDQDAAQETTPQEDAAPEATIEAATEAAPEAAAEAGADAVADALDEGADADIPECPFEVNLAKKIPCMCGTILVDDLETASPGCKKTVKCCPLGGGEIKCE